MDEKQLESVLEKVLNKKRAVDNETHASHHEFLKVYIEDYHRRREMWRKFRMSIVGTAGAAIVGFFVWLGTHIINHLSHIGK